MISRFYTSKSIDGSTILRRAASSRLRPTPTEADEAIIRCKRRTLNLYKDTTYPKRGSVPLASNGWLHFKAKGDHFSILPKEKNTVLEEKDHRRRGEEEAESFRELGLNRSMVEALANASGTRVPLAIQSLGIPKILRGGNVVLAGRTGCGKTLCYLLPLVERVSRWKRTAIDRVRGCNSPLAVVVTPSRELAVQIGLELINFSKDLGIRTKIVTGGKTKRMMRDPPVGKIDVLVGSFGVVSKLTTTKIYKLDSTRFLVLDEADALLHETFREKLRVFVKRIPIAGRSQLLDETDDRLPEAGQLVLCSATLLPSRISRVFADIVNIGSLEYLTTQGLHEIFVPQKFIRLGKSHKPERLLRYIKPKVASKQPVIVFSNENSTCNWLSMFLNGCGVKCVQLNGDMPFNVRRGKYGEFLNGKTGVLCTTNAASRGLDTVMVNHVLNYDFPLDTTDYLHRCGRTGRVGTTGKCEVTNFISTSAEVDLVKKIERAVRRNKAFPIVNMLNPDEDEGEDEDENENEKEEELEFNRTIERLEERDCIPY